MKKRHTETQILGILREAEHDRPVSDLLREHGISAPTFYRWKSKYGGIENSELRRLKRLERENKALKTIVADQALDNKILKEVNMGKWQGPPPSASQ